MNVPHDELDAWAVRCMNINGAILHALNKVRQPEPTAEQLHSAFFQLSEAQAQTAKLWRALERAGATNPIQTPRPTSSPKLLMLELLTSPANRRLLDALREVRDAAEAVDRERGYWPDSMAEAFADFVIETEREIYGPHGTSGAE